MINFTLGSISRACFRPVLCCTKLKAHVTQAIFWRRKPALFPNGLVHHGLGAHCLCFVDETHINNNQMLRLSAFFCTLKVLSVLTQMLLSVFQRLNVKLKDETGNKCLPRSESDLLYSECPAVLQCQNTDWSSRPSFRSLPSLPGAISQTFSETTVYIYVKAVSIIKHSINW